MKGWTTFCEGIRLSGRTFLWAVLLNFLWEMGQAYAYTGMPPSTLAATLMCGGASLIDGSLVLRIFWGGIIVSSRADWIARQVSVRRSIEEIGGVFVRDHAVRDSLERRRSSAVSGSTWTTMSLTSGKRSLREASTRWAISWALATVSCGSTRMCRSM